MHLNLPYKLPALLAVVFLLGAGCASVDLSDYPESSRTIFLHNFTNDSFQPDIPRELNRAMQVELLRRQNFIVQDDKQKAALFLYGRVTGFRKRGLLYDDLREPTRVELMLVCRIRLRHAGSAGGQVVASRELVTTVNFQTDRTGQAEQAARQRLAQNMASRLHSVLEQEFIRQNPQPVPNPEDEPSS